MEKTNTCRDSATSGVATWTQQQGLRCCLKNGICNRSTDNFFLVIVIFSQQTGAYCLLLGGIKLCVLVGCCGGGGILCDMGHWLLFHSSGTIMRFFFFFFFFWISVPPFSALIVFMKLCIHLSVLEQGKGKLFLKHQQIVFCYCAEIDKSMCCLNTQTRRKNIKRKSWDCLLLLQP